MDSLLKFYNMDPYTEEGVSNHRDTDEEVDFFHAVCTGNMDKVYQNCTEHRFLDQEGVGRLSKDSVINLKYHMVISAAIIARLCIDKGLEPERSYRMSDFYINKLDNATTEKEVEEIHNQMVLDYTGKMRLMRKDKGISRPITKCINYIYKHIDERITINVLAENSKVSTSYLSRQFVKELGIPISDYIRERKIEIAEERLINTDASILDIALQLSFSSQSHFIQTFKSITGMTPKKYRSLNSGKKWDMMK